MVYCTKCEGYFPTECMCVSSEDKLVCDWCARQDKNENPEARYTCDWCGEQGVKIGTEHWNMIIVKCTSCHHEWAATEENNND